ncbi:hypothetical protein [Mycolicibacterium fortuitum]|uniref:hypothetical protein n=1 Tax=Mycolicibacterium fortuitum TaxID=1766 RepID=UPI0007EA7039|nr:hypothetical protein [Mycolicibacterium fortuitum]OBB38026.1 hypothetical protein A5763_29640 [Mycolicibacterium fortuitum]OBB44867.1 hypothetical protein A5754_10505 [Mycolicibacterium fortuitum]OBB77510.1 hypothetical protein A5755_11025 [Mycolicibacterium fortuitum]OBF81446.1 hypothetical protein A5751_17080 [Mycolicibacterium fortuitum]OBG10933.1 hypothetical protein A5768_00665 [Mycolicibacterium fortuitum]
MAETKEERTPPSRWLAKWVREEKFWQDITTRTLSALIVVLLGYVYAILAGYVGAPNVPRLVAAALLVTLTAALSIAYTVYAVRRWKNPGSWPLPLGKAVAFLAPYAVLLAVVALAAAYWLLQSM